jgi:anti-anti-sigma factor
LCSYKNEITFAVNKAGGIMEIKKHSLEDIGIIQFLGTSLGEPSDTKDFEQHLNELIDQDVKKVVLDLTEVQRINSTGLAILITATTLITDCGGQKVALAGSNDFIVGALSVTKLSQFFDCYEDVNQAVEKIKDINC